MTAETWQTVFIVVAVLAAVLAVAAVIFMTASSEGFEADGCGLVAILIVVAVVACCCSGVVSDYQAGVGTWFVDLW